MPIPRPPYLPDDVEDLRGDRFNNNLQLWLAYIRESCRYLEESDAAVSNAQEQANQALPKVDALKQQIVFLNEERAEERRQADSQAQKHIGVIEYQEKLLREKDERCLRAEMEKEKAIALATPTVPTPLSPNTPAPVAEKATDPVPRTSSAAIATPPESSRASERLPDPDKFQGERKDLRRFTSQIQEKLTVNIDRFPSPKSRCAYVTSRLSGAAYAQILPYIRGGVCQLADYQEILDILDRAFGDPNRVNNARNELYRLRQSNKEFSAFFAEFQRLALEGEMPENSLPTMLEQSINRELRAMLLHHEPPSREYLPFAQFLQNLENRRRLYETPTFPPPRSYPQSPREKPAPPQHHQQRKGEGYFDSPPPAADPMDLSTQKSTRVNGRRERNECYRCGSATHLVRDCPQPDLRKTVRASAGLTARTNSPNSWNPHRSPTPPRGRRLSPQSSPSRSVNGVSLN